MEVLVSPDMQFYNLLESYPYNPASAICEYIDNALQAFLDSQNKIKEKKLKIELKFKFSSSESFIEIRDYGTGISLENLQRALKPAYQPKNQSLSEFGIGMKAASIWFSRHWQLESYPLGENKGFKIDFNLDNLLSKNNDKINVETFEKDINNSGVSIYLLNLKNSFSKDSIDDLWLKLQEIYQIFIYRKDAILDLTAKYNGTSLQKNNTLHNIPDVLLYPKFEIYKAQSYSFGKEKLWKQDVKFEFENHLIKGFLCVMKTSSQTSNPGIRLFRYNRLIKGFEKLPYKPIALVGTANKHAPSRVYGELHLDGQKISNHKGDFLFDERFFLETLKVQPGINELIDQAENYRANDARDGKVQHFDTEDKYLEYVKKTKKPLEGQAPTTPVGTKKPQSKQQKKTPIDILKNANIPSEYFILNEIRNEAIELFNKNLWLSFCLCYRTILELGVIYKLKAVSQNDYEKAKEKGIAALINYLSGNSNLVDENKHRALRRILKNNVGEIMPYIDLMNIASHGHYRPFQPDTETLLINTECLLNWAFE